MARQAVHHRRPSILPAQAYRELLARNRLRQDDAAWMTGVGVRQARAWGLDEWPVPQYAGLLLMAYDEGKIDAAWLISKLGDPPA